MTELLLAHQDRLDLTGVAAHRLDLPACGERKFAVPRLARKRIQIQPLENHFPLHGFLPGLEQPVTDFQVSRRRGRPARRFQPAQQYGQSSCPTSRAWR